MVRYKKQKCGLFFIDKEVIIAYNLLSFLRRGPVVSRPCGIRAQPPTQEVVPTSREGSTGHEELKIWTGSSIWLEHLPVTQEVASSSLVRSVFLKAPHTEFVEVGAFFILKASSSSSVQNHLAGL